MVVVPQAARTTSPPTSCVQTENIFHEANTPFVEYAPARETAERLADRSLPIPPAPDWVDSFEVGTHTAHVVPASFAPEEARLVDGASFKYVDRDHAQTVLLEFYALHACPPSGSSNTVSVYTESRDVEVWPSSGTGVLNINGRAYEYETRDAVFMLDGLSVVISIQWERSEAPGSDELTEEIQDWVAQVTDSPAAYRGR
jgi:hypothetical protein